MENQIIIGIIGLIGVYAIYRMLTAPMKQNSIEKDQYDILNDEKHKVKGQWDR